MSEKPQIGTRFGSRVIHGYPEIKGRVLMLCDCGRIDETKLSRILDGSSLRCMPCSKRKNWSEILPPLGTSFRKRIVIGYVPQKPHRDRELIMLCECGNIGNAEWHALLKGELTRCKHCWVVENLDNLHEKTKEKNALRDPQQFRIHQPEYPCWRAMISRCCNPNDQAYSRYGGAGIRVCDEWFDYEQFKKDMGPRSSKEFTIERADGKGHYNKENASWQDWYVQANNRKNNTILEFNGKSQTVAQWSRELNIDASTIHGRIKRNLPIEKIFEKPR